MKKFVISMLAVFALASSVNAGIVVPADQSASGTTLEQIKESFNTSSAKALKKISKKDQDAMMNSGALQQLEALQYLIDMLDKRWPKDNIRANFRQYVENAYGVSKDLDEAEYAAAFEDFTTLQIQDICIELTWRLYKLFEIE